MPRKKKPHPQELAQEQPQQPSQPAATPALSPDRLRAVFEEAARHFRLNQEYEEQREAERAAEGQSPVKLSEEEQAEAENLRRLA